MIELNFGKLLLVAVIALVVLGPDKLPKAARMAGAMLRRLRLGWQSVRGEVEYELKMEEVRRAMQEAKERTQSLHKTIDDEMRSVGKETREQVESLRKTVDDEVRSAGAVVNDAAAKVADIAAPVDAPMAKSADGAVPIEKDSAAGESRDGGA